MLLHLSPFSKASKEFNNFQNLAMVETIILGIIIQIAIVVVSMSSTNQKGGRNGAISRNSCNVSILEIHLGWN